MVLNAENRKIEMVVKRVSFADAEEADHQYWAKTSVAEPQHFLAFRSHTKVQFYFHIRQQKHEHEWASDHLHKRRKQNLSIHKF